MVQKDQTRRQLSQPSGRGVCRVVIPPNEMAKICQLALGWSARSY
jgi:hypothetical protein